MKSFWFLIFKKSFGTFYKQHEYNFDWIRMNKSFNKDWSEIKEAKLKMTRPKKYVSEMECFVFFFI